MATNKNHLFDGALGGDWADESVQHAPEPKAATGSAWGTKPQQKKEEMVDFSKIQAEEKTKAKQAEPGRPGRREDFGDHSGRSDYPPRRDDSNTYKPPTRDYPRRDEDGYKSRDYGRRDDHNGYRPREYPPRRDGDFGGYKPREETERPPLLKEIPADMVLNPPYIIRLGNLNYQMTDDYLYEYFEGLGVVRASIATDERGRSKGFGFVEFDSRNGIECALQCNSSEELLMDRAFQITIHQKKEVDRPPRYGFGPGPGEQSRSFERPPRSNFERPSGPPSLGLKPRTVDVDAKPRDPSPKKKAAGEDPFGGAALDSEKFKQRQQREAERDEKRRAELDKIRADKEKEMQEKQAKAEEEKKKREESWRLEKQTREQKALEEAEKKRKEKEDTGPDNWRSNPNKWNNKPQGNKKEESPKKYGSGVGRGQEGFKGQGKGDFKAGRGAGRGEKGGFRGQGKSEGGKGPNKPTKSQEAPTAEDGPDAFVTPKDYVKKPPTSYKAALGTQDQVATVNPFAALQHEAPEEGGDQ